jgi:hypothetical protein
MQSSSFRLSFSPQRSLSRCVYRREYPIELLSIDVPAVSPFIMPNIAVPSHGGNVDAGSPLQAKRHVGHVTSGDRNDGPRPPPLSCAREHLCARASLFHGSSPPYPLNKGPLRHTDPRRREFGHPLFPRLYGSLSLSLSLSFSRGSVFRANDCLFTKATCVRDDARTRCRHLRSSSCGSLVAPCGHQSAATAAY